MVVRAVAGYLLIDTVKLQGEVMTLFVINVVAAMFVLLGFHVAFRQRLVLAWVARLRRSDGTSSAATHAQVAPGDREEIASVFRIAGVMIMAFSFTIAAFTNLIAYYTAVSVG